MTFHTNECNKTGGATTTSSLLAAHNRSKWSYKCVQNESSANATWGAKCASPSRTGNRQQQQAFSFRRSSGCSLQRLHNKKALLKTLFSDDKDKRERILKRLDHSHTTSTTTIEGVSLLSARASLLQRKLIFSPMSVHSELSSFSN